MHCLCKEDNCTIVTLPAIYERIKEVKTGNKVLALPTIKTLPIDVLIIPNSFWIWIAFINFLSFKCRCKPADSLYNKLNKVFSWNNSKKKLISILAASFGNPFEINSFCNVSNFFIPFSDWK